MRAGDCMAEKKTISGLEEFIPEILNLAQTLKVDVHYNEMLFYRGQGDKGYSLRPSLARNKLRFSNISLLDFERALIESAQKRLPSIFPSSLSPINLLALLQHYGIPTRLLDITLNPLVALYFACQKSGKDGDADGEVIVFKDNQADLTTYPVINALADTYRFGRDTITNLALFYEKVIEQPYFDEQRMMLKNRYQDIQAGGEWIARCCKEIIFVHAQELSPRQISQQGRFILFPNKVDKKYGLHFTTEIAEIEKDHKSIAALFHVPREKKDDILKQLAAVGITRSALFSDSIDIVCEEIKQGQIARLKMPADLPD